MIGERRLAKAHYAEASWKKGQPLNDAGAADWAGRMLEK